MAWVCSRVAALGTAQVEIVAPRPGSSDVAVLSSRLEGNTWDASVAVFDARVSPWHLAAHLPLHDTASALVWSEAAAGTFLVGSDSGEVLVLRAPGAASKDATPRLLASLRFHDDAVTCLAVPRADSGTSIAVSGSADRRLAVWDVSTGGLRSAPSAVLAGHSAGVTCAAFSPSVPSLLATGAGAPDCAALLWDLRAPAAPVTMLHCPGGGGVTALAWLPAAAASAASAAPQAAGGDSADDAMAPQGRPPAAAAAEASTASFLAVGCEDGRVRVFDARPSGPGVQVLATPARLADAPLATLPLVLRGPVRCVVASQIDATASSVTLDLAWSGDDSRVGTCRLQLNSAATPGDAASGSYSDARWAGDSDEAAAPAAPQPWPPLPLPPPLPAHAPAKAGSWASKLGGGGGAAPPPPAAAPGPAAALQAAMPSPAACPWHGDYIRSIAWWSEPPPAKEAAASAGAAALPVLLTASWDGAVNACRRQ